MSLAKSILFSGLASQVPNPASPATIKTNFFISPICTGMASSAILKLAPAAYPAWRGVGLWLMDSLRWRMHAFLAAQQSFDGENLDFRIVLVVNEGQACSNLASRRSLESC